jgi:hypothetical protein
MKQTKGINRHKPTTDTMATTGERKKGREAMIDAFTQH